VTKHILLKIWFLDLVVSACKSDGIILKGHLNPPSPSPKAVSAQWQMLSAFIWFPSTCGRLPASTTAYSYFILNFFLIFIVMTI
jgi:hypothetical protein